jgi:uncharacterized membrane protein HdeD (DUF308 family)
MTNPFNLWLADLLGIYVGFVVSLETVLVLLGIALFLVGMAHLMVELQYKYRESEGLEKFGWFLLLILPTTILFLVHWIAVLAVVATIAGMLSGKPDRRYKDRDW